MRPDSKNTVGLARQALNRGNFAECEALCRQVLSDHPQSADALIMLAEIAARSGRNAQARQLLRLAIKFEPKHVRALLTLARSLRSVRAHAEAADLCVHAVEQEPDNPEPHLLLAICYIDLWRIPEAIETLNEAIRLNPKYGPAFDRLGYALFLRGRYDEGIDAYERAVELMPKVPNSFAILGKLRERQGETEAALRDYDRAFDVASSGLEPMLSLARTHQTVGNLERAEVALRAAVAKAPKALRPQMELARVLQNTGKFGEAVELLEKCLANHPDSSAATLELFRARLVTDADSHLLSAIRNRLETSTLAPEDRVQNNYALGKALDDLGEYEEAMQRFREANRVAHEIAPTSPGDRASHADLIASMISRFKPEFYPAHVGSGSTSSEPVFIVGMPRSGTTLIEQIVSSHPQVAAVGELSYLSCRGLQLINPKEDPKEENIRELAEGYLRRIRFDSMDAARVTDKMSNNYMIAGMIHLIFPNARIINCRRNPIDTCLSIFLTPIVVEFSHSLHDIAFSYREYTRITAHWRKVLPPDRFTDVDYEDLVSNPEPHVRRLAQFIDLPWDEAMLNPAANSRSVSTASRWQVRQALHTRSVERWRRYAPWIPELLEEFPEFSSSADGPRLL